MAIFCQILLTRPKKGTHTPGDVVEGVIKYVIDKKTKFRKIELTFWGIGNCRWTEGSREKRKVYRGHDEIIRETITFNDKQTEEQVYEPGFYEHPFTFTIPPNAPATYEDNYCEIKYYVEINFDKPFFSGFSRKFQATINVKNYINPEDCKGTNIFGLEKKLFKPFSSKDHIVKLKTEISDTAFSLGQQIDFVYEVKNESDVKITSIRTELIEHNTYIANCNRQKEVYKTINESAAKTPEIPRNALANMNNSITIPLLNPNNIFTKELFSINSSVIVRKYVVKVTVRLPMPYINDSVVFPVIIGERIDDGSFDDEGDLPPSYMEVITEDLGSFEKLDKG